MSDDVKQSKYYDADQRALLIALVKEDLSSDEIIARTQSFRKPFRPFDN